MGRRLSVGRRVWLGAWGLVRLGVLLVLCGLGLVMTVAGGLLSPWGTGVAVTWLDGVEGVSIGGHEGAPLERLVLEDVVVARGGQRLAVDRFEWAWAPGCWLSGRLCVERVLVDGVRGQLGGGAGAERGAEPGVEAVGRSRLPFPVEVRAVEVRDVSVGLPEGRRLGWSSFSSALVGAGSRVEVGATRWEGLWVFLPGSEGALLTEGVVGGVSAAGVNGALALASGFEGAVVEAEPSVEAVEGPGGRSLGGEGLGLPAVVLPVDVSLEVLRVTDAWVGGAFEARLDEGVLVAEAVAGEVVVERLSLLGEGVDLELGGRVGLEGAYPLSVDVRAALALGSWLEGGAEQRVDLALRGDLGDLAAELALEGMVSGALSARGDLVSPEVPFSLLFEAEALGWPLAVLSGPMGAALPVGGVRVEAPRVEVSGDLGGYEALVGGRVVTEAFVPAEVRLRAAGDLAQLAWQSLKVRSSAGELSSSGRVRWGDEVSLIAALAVEGLDTGAFVEGLEGRLGGEARLEAAQSVEGWDFDVRGLEVAGDLMGYPLSLSAAVSGGSDLTFDIERLAFVQGENRLTASGGVSREAVDVVADVDLQALGSLVPGLEGRVEGALRAGGRPLRPEVGVDLVGEALAMGGARVGALSLEAVVSGLEDPAFDVSGSAREVGVAGGDLGAVEWGLEGRVSDHRVSLDVGGGDPGALVEALAVRFVGGLDEGGEMYGGRLEALSAVAPSWGRLALEAPVGVEVALERGTVSLEPFCVRRVEGGVLCLEAPLVASAAAGEARLSLDEVPLGVLEPWLPEGVEVLGGTGADLEMAWGDGGQAWEARLVVRGDAEVTALDAFGRPVGLPGAEWEAVLEASEAAAEVRASLDLEGAGEVALAVVLEDPLNLAGLGGDLVVEGVTLSPYAPLVGGLEGVSGELNGEVALGGTLKAPSLRGGVRLSGLSAGGPDLPVGLETGELLVDLEGRSASLGGFLGARQGRLEVSGQAAWPAVGPWSVGVDVDGSEAPLLVSLPPFGELEAAPVLSVGVSPARLEVRGEVNLPWAVLEVGGLPASAEAPSEDEVIITARDDEAAAERRGGLEASESEAVAALAAQGMALDVLVTIGLGERMQLSAYGLETGLGGALEVRQDSGGLQLFGDVSLVEGRFEAFGQDLRIRRGQILFSGPPGLPTLDFEAIRNPEVTEDGVVAGLEVTGLADQPEVSIFSEPAMNEARALSYLLRGSAPEARGGGFDSALTTALIGMSIGRTGSTVGAIGEAFGVSDLKLDTAGSGEGSQVEVTGQLGDDLEVSYGVGIFSPIAELTLRYTLWRNLYVQAVSGTNQAVDLVYQFSREGNPARIDDR